MKLTKKMFIEYLNKEFGVGSWRNNRYHNPKRPYGTYLYAQDRDMFNANFDEWKEDIEKRSS